MIPMPVQVWGLRILFLGGLGILPSALTGSSFPALAFALTWGLNGLFLWWFMQGTLHLPHFLVPIHPVEPVIYRWVGVGFIKRIVATRAWSLMNGMEPPSKPANRQALLDRTELSTKGAEVCHGATFLLAFFVAMFLLAAGQAAEAAWLLALNVLLNGYPIMLQRVNRRRVQQITR